VRAPTGSSCAPDRTPPGAIRGARAPFDVAILSARRVWQPRESAIVPLADCDTGGVEDAGSDAPRRSPGGCVTRRRGDPVRPYAPVPGTSRPAGPAHHGHVRLRLRSLRAEGVSVARSVTASACSTPCGRAGPGSSSWTSSCPVRPGHPARRAARRGAAPAGHRDHAAGAPRLPAAPAARRPRRLPAAPLRRRRAGRPHPAAARRRPAPPPGAAARRAGAGRGAGRGDRGRAPGGPLAHRAGAAQGPARGTRRGRARRTGSPRRVERGRLGQPRAGLHLLPAPQDRSGAHPTVRGSGYVLER
jgi:hypothetical protein